MSLVEFKNVSKIFKQKKSQQTVLKNIDFKIEAGEIFGIIGYSGAGKSTLIRCVNGIEKPTTGEVLFEGAAINKISDAALRKVRGEIGMIFQQFNLMPNRTIAENIALPIRHSGLKKSEIQEKVKNLLKLVGLPEKADVYPSALSGGQKQRVAIARALVNDPKILLCDEATSALDPQTTKAILTLLKDLNQKLNLTLIIVTHEMGVIEDVCDQVAVLDSGEIVESGNVYEIFLRPSSALTKQFLETTSRLSISAELVAALKLKKNQQLVKLTYITDETIVPLISQISRKFQIDANIIVGDIKLLQNKPLGGLIIVLAGEATACQQTIAYLQQQPNIQVEVIHHAGIA